MYCLLPAFTQTPLIFIQALHPLLSTCFSPFYTFTYMHSFFYTHAPFAFISSHVHSPLFSFFLSFYFLPFILSPPFLFSLLPPIFHLFSFFFCSFFLFFPFFSLSSSFSLFLPSFFPLSLSFLLSLSLFPSSPLSPLSFPYLTTFSFRGGEAAYRQGLGAPPSLVWSVLGC